MTFASPLWLLALAAVPALVWAARRSTGAPAVGFSVASDAAAAGLAGWSRWRHAPAWLLLAALALVAVALARPQRLDARVSQSTEGIDIVLVLDTSPSMRARDFPPDRFEAAKAVAAEFIRGRESDRIGLVVFAGQAYTQAPLTLDYGFLLSMLREVRMGLIADGTAIGTAIATAAARLRDSDATSKVIVLLTDGENNQGQVDPRTAAEAAAAFGVKIYAVGMGNPEAATRRGPYVVPGAPAAAGEVDEATLQDVARLTNGRYFRATDVEALREIYAAISGLERTQIEQTTYLDAEDLYAWPLGLALALALAGVGLAATRLRTVP